MEQQSQGQGGRRRQIPAFGRWNQHSVGDEVPITQYFESAVQASLLARPGHCYHDAGAGEVLLFRSSASPPPHKPPKKVRSTTECHGHHQQVQVEEVGSRRRQQQRRRQEPLPPFVSGDVSRAARPRVVRAAVDEDLYKVPSDMLRKKKGRKHVRSVWMGCVGLTCVA
ncbi:uncharacterized protein [Zea mays]|uniref:Uncharacterized protein n=1 Tax=Zea mays TaxID=4577 RepID=A0A804ULG4_MAIZE|nr:uncharacterized protein LOC100194146 isoform X2 [Zea mays]|eukprot:XP_008661467.1 uncharacterized protein LOC100194146 isoform X2 [Zea mays]